MTTQLPANENKTRDILVELSAARRADAAAREAQLPYRQLLRQIAETPEPKDFAAAFRARKGAPRIIAELKKASPSEGLIRADFQPEELAVELEAAGAAALSVLCEPHRFLGDERYLRAARQRVKLPILYKDFVTTNYQVAEARLAGADAVLLIAAVLDDAELRALKAQAHELGLKALVETHDAEEIRRAVDLGCEVIGVNCRNLRTFATDVALIEELIGRIPSTCVRIAESGMHTAAAIRAAQAAGADGFLVGTALMRAERSGEKLKELMGCIDDGEQI